MLIFVSLLIKRRHEPEESRGVDADYGEIEMLCRLVDDSGSESRARMRVSPCRVGWDVERFVGIVVV